ncbi:MAG: glucose-6-phosphate isomerase [Patescibacteria group bacterium]|nr:glucose-6-phosphate isomerase [Patescibacteria group bacterium]
MLISYDFKSAIKEKIGLAGTPKKSLAALSPRLKRIRDGLKKAHEAGSLGFLGIPERRLEIRDTIELAKEVSRRFKTLIVIGIGGSDLGARAFVRALDEGKGMDVRFIGANTDPEEIADLLASVDLKKCALNVISKSGGTIEPMSTFLLLRDRLIRKVGKKAHAKHVIATTDKEKGVLREIADREGYRTLPVPDDIGGRFSALTPVGLFPAACAGIDVDALVRGAKKVRERFLSIPMSGNNVLNYCAIHYLGYARCGQNIHVLMPYAARLDLLGDWYRQLWAESLGNRLSRKGRVVNHGPTPVSALGATDQHSQIQLYNEGPFDKIITFIEVERMRDDFIVPKAYSDLKGVAYMGGHKFSHLLRSEKKATASALTRNGRPNGTVKIPSISSESVGALMMFFMLATAVMGELLDVNVYDQPGVEAGKKAMDRILGRKR